MLPSLMRAARHLCVEFWQARATVLYAFALAITTVTMQSANPRIASQVVLSASTNLTNMADHPVRALLASPFMIQGDWGSWAKAALCVLVLFPAERWLGSLRATAVFVAGHVGATLLTQGAIMWGIHQGIVPSSAANMVDVGMSYGVAAVVGVLTYRWSQPLARLAWAGFWLVYLGYDPLFDPTFTGFGHVLAILTGFLAYPLIPRTRENSAEAPREGASAG